MAALLIAVLAAAVLVWRERTWRRTVAALRGERDRTRAELHDVSGLARDLRSPLQGVIGNTELIMAGDRDADTAEELREIHTHAARAAGIVRTMAAVAATSRLSRRWQDVNDIVAHAVESSRATRREAGTRVDVECAERLPLVYVDGPQLERVLVMLLERPGASRDGGAATLRTARRGSDDRLVIEYDDPASAADPERAADLSVCRRVAEAHGGSLEVESPPHGGFRFVLELPVWTT